MAYQFSDRHSYLQAVATEFGWDYDKLIIEFTDIPNEGISDAIRGKELSNRAATKEKKELLTNLKTFKREGAPTTNKHRTKKK